MKDKWRIKILAGLGICLLIGTTVYMSFNYREVKGTDDKIAEVTGVYARKAGVARRLSYINTDKGDILLFLFGFSGLVAGFYLGYHWRAIISQTPIFDGPPPTENNREE